MKWLRKIWRDFNAPVLCVPSHNPKPAPVYRRPGPKSP